MQSLESKHQENNLILNVDVIQQYTSFQKGGKHKSNVITLKASFSLHIDIEADHITSHRKRGKKGMQMQTAYSRSKRFWESEDQK